MIWMLLTRIALAVQRLDAHPTHQRSDVPTADDISGALQEHAQHSSSRKRALQMQFIDHPHHRKIGLRHRNRLVIHRRTREPEHLGLADRQVYWRGRALTIRAKIEDEAWDEAHGRFAASFGGEELDASLLQLVETRFLPPDDPRYLATFEAVEKELRRGSYLFRYAAPDDFGEPETAFNFCTFWFIEALNLAGRTEEARALFEEMLSRRTAAGLLSEDIGLQDGRLWGNYPQTYSLVGVINCAMLLSRPWSAVR
jgi:pentatricopeptide repeat protein